MADEEQILGIKIPIRATKEHATKVAVMVRRFLGSQDALKQMASEGMDIKVLDRPDSEPDVVLEWPNRVLGTKPPKMAEAANDEVFDDRDEY